MMTFLERAKVLTARGIPVIPVRPKSKVAFIANWQNLATVEFEQLLRWNRADSTYNTGAVGKSDGFLIFDVDDAAVYDQLLTAGIDLAAIRTFKVQGKKANPLGHYYFTHTDATRGLGNCSWEIRSRATGKKLTTRFDVKGNNGYVVGPGSIHPDGPVYTIVEDAPIVPMPDDLAAWIIAHKGTVWMEDAESCSGANGNGRRRPGSLKDRVLDIIANCSGKSYEEVKAFIAKYDYSHRYEADEAIAQYLFQKHKGNRAKVEEEFARVALMQGRNNPYYQLTIDKAAKWYAANLAESNHLVPSEDELALAFTARHPDLRYTAGWSRWHEWEGVRWAEDATVRVYDLVREQCREAGEQIDPKHTGARNQLMKSSTVAGVERLARSDRRHAMTVDMWDTHPMLLNTPAGVVDLKNGDLRPARPENYLTKLARVGPDPNCTPHRWLEFLAQIFDGDAQVIAHIQKWAGYCLTGLTTEHALVFSHGNGGNGKSTLWNTLAWVLGDYADTAASETFMLTKNERHPEEMASLRGLRMVIASEIREGCRWNEARIKDLTGGDKIRARFMCQNSFSFQPQFKLIIFGNHKPRLYAVNEAMRRRLHFLSFNVTIPPEHRDPHLREKLEAEAPGILQWAIEGCLSWQNDGLEKPASVEASTQLYFAEQDRIADWMAENCEMGADFITAVPLLYGNWKAWAEANGEHPGTARGFQDRLEIVPALRHVRTKHARGIQGIRLRVTPGDGSAYPGRITRAGVYTCGNGESVTTRHPCDYVPGSTGVSDYKEKQGGVTPPDDEIEPAGVL